MIGWLATYWRGFLHRKLNPPLWDAFFFRREQTRAAELFSSASLLTNIRETNGRTFFFDPSNQKDFFLTLLTSTESLESILEEADDVLQNRFQALGSPNVELGGVIHWQRDFKSGIEWPLRKSGTLDLLDLDRTSDVKVPWELSRFSQVWWLGKAYWLTHNEAYAEKFRDLITDWIAANPIGRGVNWAVAMEVAIRSWNWIAGYYFFRNSPSLTDEFWRTFFASLYLHGTYIRWHLEYSRRNGNHLIAGLSGLFAVGIFFRSLPAGDRWVRFAQRALEEEMEAQVTDDGVNYEQSVWYHRLVTELFAASHLLGTINGIRFKAEFGSRLERMFDFLAAATRPDGSFSPFGDSDDGQLFRFTAGAPLASMAPILLMGGLIFDRREFVAAAGSFHQAALWYFGGEGFERYQRMKDAQRDNTTKAFPGGGFYFLRTSDVHIGIDAGESGFNGWGGHGHNDVLTFTLWARGKEFIVDSGTWGYTSDVRLRNSFRGTEAHNSVMVDSMEISEFAGLWKIKKDYSKPEILEWHSYAETDLLRARHHAYERLPQPVTHTRTFRLAKKTNTLTITDAFSGSGVHVLQAAIHLHPDVTVETVEQNQYVLVSGIQHLKVEFSEPAEVVPTQYSPQYGVSGRNQSLLIRFSRQLPCEIVSTFQLVN